MNIVDREEVDPLEETTMLIWDPDLPMPSDDLFEVQEPPTEVLVVQTHEVGVNLPQTTSPRPKLREENQLSST
jgi:hypothetical protein